MITKKQMAWAGGYIALTLFVCAFLLIVCKPSRIENGIYASSDGYRMEVSEKKIVVCKGKGEIPFATLPNKTKIDLVDPDDETGIAYVVSNSTNGVVMLVRKEKPPFERKEFLFLKDM